MTRSLAVPRSSAAQYAGWVLVALLVVVAWRARVAAARAETPRSATSGSVTWAERSLAERLLGPVASLAAAAMWVRADVALRAGEHSTAYARAETALELEPSRADAWIYFAHHLVFERASLSRTVDPDERRAWVQAGFDVLERGARESRDPGEVLSYRGLVFDYLAAVPDADRPWPGTAREALLEAARAFDAARAAGAADAAELADIARAKAAELAR
jgi:hypothetical protein